MARNDSNVSAQSTTGGLGGLNFDLNTGLSYDADGNAVVRDIDVPDGTEIVQTGQIGAFRRTVFSNGQVEIVQTKPANAGDGSIATPVALPGEQQDVTGTGMDADTKPKLMSGGGKSSDKK